MKMIVRNIAVLIAFASLTPCAYAGTIVKPYTFTNGSTADANQVNADFDALYSQTNKNTTNISSLSTNLAKAITLINSRVVKTTSPYHTANGYVSDVIVATCASNEVIVGGTCSCNNPAFSTSTTNWGTVAFCDIAGNSVIGTCFADYGIYSASKLGPPVTAYATCLSAARVPATTLQKTVASTPDEAQDPFKAERDAAIEKIMEQQQEYIQQRQYK